MGTEHLVLQKLWRCTMAHLNEQSRSMIQNLLDGRFTPLAIAHKLNRAHSTIVREIRKHRRENEEDKKRKKNFCVFRKTCYKKDLCKVPPGNCPGRCSCCKILVCRTLCEDYREDTCNKLARSPYVCNGCLELAHCQKRKYFYSAISAEKEYQTDLHECRTGIDASENELQQYDFLIKQGGRNGQSLHHIIEAHKDVFQKCEKTVYNYFNQNFFSLPRGEMPKMCIRKNRKKGIIRHKVDPKCRVGRNISDYNKFIAEHPKLPRVQMDSVVGRVGGKVLLTLQFEESGMLLAWLREANNSQSVIDYFDMMERKFGLTRFRHMFPLILTDNGPEFSNPSAIETSITGKQRTRVFYCDPNASWQKGKIENNHTNLRRILEHGCSFDNLTQNDIDLVLSHVNSYIREKYGNIPAASRFSSIFGDDCLDMLNIKVIPPEKVILNPNLLKGKI